MALMFGIEVAKVVVKGFRGTGQFGRSNGGNGGAEDDAVMMLSKFLGKPVCVQWMRGEDMQWSPQPAAAFADIEISLDANGKMIGYLADHYSPPLNDDRPVGAVLAGLPTMAAPSPNRQTSANTATINVVQDAWPYDSTPAVLKRGHGAFHVAEKESPIAIGQHVKSMRTPSQLQQNFGTNSQSVRQRL
jgi:nicotinate dehydrogenase subunit B